MTDWIDRFRASVNWGDEIHAGTLPDGCSYCWVKLGDGCHAWVPGTLKDLPGAIALAHQAMRMSARRSVTAMLLDQQATDYQVEEACHLLARAGVGCDFLDVQPRVLRDGLLLRMSEGTLLDSMSSSDPAA